MSKLTKVNLKLVNKGNFHSDIILPNGTTWSLDQPIHSVLGMLFTCELHMMKLWSHKLKIDLKDIRIKDVEGELNMKGLLNHKGEKSGFNNIKGTFEIVSSATKEDFKKLVELA